MRAMALAAVCGALGACSASGPGPAPRAVDPASAVEGDSVEVLVFGDGFRPRVVLDLDRPRSSEVNAAFTVLFGEAPAPEVTWVDAGTLRARLPAALAAGRWDVTVVDPRGARGVLEAGFEVTARPPSRVSVETLPGGAGAPVGDQALRLGSVVALYAAERRLDGGFVRDLGAAWSVVGGVGEVSPATGSSTAFTATAPGIGRVVARAPPLADGASGLFLVSACAVDGDCRDACHGQATCARGRCLPGPVDKDSDGDGALDQRCVGGTDCDDSNPQVSPFQYEGPPWGPACRNGLDDNCNGLVDLADPTCAPGSAPLAALALTPPWAPPGAALTGDASGTVDREQPAASLRYEWDWDGDGVYEALGVRTSHAFAAAGVYLVTVRVWDSEGLWGLATTRAVVAAPAEVGVVTIAGDESDPGATPADPGGAGFSLREALAWADATAGPQVVVLPSAITAAVRAPLRLGSSSRATLLGGGTLDCSALSGSQVCLEAAGGAPRLLHLTVRGAPGTAVSLSGAGAQLSDAVVHGSGTGVDASGADAVVGPAVEVFGNGVGVTLSGRAQLLDSAVHGQGGAGVVARAGSAGAQVVGNRVYDNGGQGVDVAAQAGALRLYFNTVHANGQAGVRVSASAGGVDVRANLLTGNAGWGLDAAGASLAAVDANDLFGNLLGGCRQCGALGALALAVDPGYVSAALRDLRPGVLSPVIDRGLDLGVDRNGVAPGNYLGLAPEPGACEVR